MKTKGLIALAALVLISGCGNKTVDSDGDGIVDSKDKCPDSPPGCVVDANGCQQEGEMAQEKSPEQQQAAQSSTPDAGIPQVAGDTITTPSGLKYIEMTVGTGAQPAAGQLIRAHYTGWLLDGKKFDSSRDRGAPLEFPIGQGRVIKGWDEGLSSMKVGGRRMLIIPSNLAYGPNGRPPVIPGGATLVFDVELVGIP